MVQPLQNRTVMATLVADDERLSFLPKYFGNNHYTSGEILTFSWMSRLSEDYIGGFWNFYELSNGGFYLAPGTVERYRVCVYSNDYRGEVSADAAGIIATFFALGQLAAAVNDPEENGPLIDHYHHLLEFADAHPEGGAIFRAID